MINNNKIAIILSGSLILTILSFAFNFSKVQADDDTNLLEVLNLNSQQLEETNKLYREYRRQINAIDRELSLIQIDIREELLKENPSINRIDELLEKRKVERTKRLMAGMEALIKLQEILTPEQWQELKRVRIDERFLN
jgi:Spy/CpxP family protein refolding chaperone